MSKCQDNLEFILACQSQEYVFVHAAACAVDGLGIVIPGRTFAGKTTLLRALVEAGASFFSDEFAVLDEEGNLYPFPRHLSVRQEGQMVGDRVDPRDLGYELTQEPVPLGLVAEIQYDSARGWDVVERTAGESTLALFNNTVAARKIPLQAMRAFMTGCSRANGLQGTRGEAAEAARYLMTLVRETPLASAPLKVEPFTADFS